MEKFLTVQVFGTSFDLQFLSQNSSNFSLLCSDPVSNNGVPFICFLFPLIKIFKTYYLHFFKSLSQGALYTDSTLASIAFMHRYLVVQPEAV